MLTNITEAVEASSSSDPTRAITCPCRASDGAVRKMRSLSSRSVTFGDVEDGEQPMTPFGMNASWVTCMLTPEEAGPVIMG